MPLITYWADVKPTLTNVASLLERTPSPTLKRSVCLVIDGRGADVLAREGAPAELPDPPVVAAQF